jgi:hypothetical protein
VIHSPSQLALIGRRNEAMFEKLLAIITDPQNTRGKGEFQVLYAMAILKAMTEQIGPEQVKTILHLANDTMRDDDLALLKQVEAAGFNGGILCDIYDSLEVIDPT